MPDLFASIPNTHVRVSHDFVETLIQTQREELFTGLMRLHYPSGENLVLTFLQGIEQKLYRRLEKLMEVIPRQSWSNSLDRPNASIALLNLSVEGMRFMRVVHEAPILQEEELNCSPQELMNHTVLWAADKSPGAVHVQAERLNKLYLIAGNSSPIIEELSVAGTEARFSLSDASFPKSLPQAEYQITRYISDSGHDVWQEYELRFAFNPLMRMLLNRFSELAGRVLTERLCEQVSHWLKDGGWNINITINGVTNHHYFESIEDAKRAYLEIVRRFNYEAGPAIGSRMADGISREILLKMDPYRHELLKRHIYDLYGFDTAVARVER